MARGWESKSVESQQEEATRPRAHKPALTPAQQADEERRRTLVMTRARTLADLGRATSPGHREMLKHAIKSLEEQLSSLPKR
jgi:hypothetical protein